MAEEYIILTVCNAILLYLPNACLYSSGFLTFLNPSLTPTAGPESRRAYFPPAMQYYPQPSTGMMLKKVRYPAQAGNMEYEYDHVPELAATPHSFVNTMARTSMLSLGRALGGASASLKAACAQSNGVSHVISASPYARRYFDWGVTGKKKKTEKGRRRGKKRLTTCNPLLAVKALHDHRLVVPLRSQIVPLDPLPIRRVVRRPPILWSDAFRLH